jgi:hypothetical protein
MMSDLFDEILKFTTVEEATAKDLMRKQKSITRLFPSFPDRVKAVADKGGIRLENVEDDSWHFKIHSGTKDDVWYDAYIEFKDIVGDLAKVIKDRRLWVKDKSRIDRRKMARKLANIADIQINCSCPADKYWGGHYIRSLDRYDAKQGDRETRPPRIRNPKQYGAYCKHLQNLMKVLPFYNDTMMRWVDDFYGDEVRTFEEETKKEYGWVTQAAQKLAKRIEPKEEEPAVEEPVAKAVAKEPEEEKAPKARRRRVRKVEPEETEPEEEKAPKKKVKKKVPAEKEEEPSEQEEELDSEEEKKKKDKEERMARRKKDREEREANKKKKKEEPENEEEEVK